MDRIEEMFYEQEEPLKKKVEDAIEKQLKILSP
jgi:hypothetical protein